MPLIRCKECGKEISDTTSECIHCGAPTSLSLSFGRRYKIKGILMALFIITVIAILIVVCIVFFNSKANNKTLSRKFNAKYSAPELPSAYDNPFRKVLTFKEDGTVMYQLCNGKTDACDAPYYYTYIREGLEISIYDGNYLKYNCSLNDSQKLLNCDNNGEHKTYARID